MLQITKKKLYKFMKNLVLLLPSLVNNFKKQSFANRNEFIDKFTKTAFLSTGKAVGLCEEPQDWLAIATRCSINPNHEHFGKAPEKILEIWNNKSKIGSERGNTLEDYIRFKISGDDEAIEKFYDYNCDDENLIGKTQSFNKIWDTTISKINHVGSELWLTDSDLGTSIRLDDLFVNFEKKTFFIFDWKNNDNISYENRFRKYIGGGMLGMDVCDAHKFHFQVQSYRYIIEKYLKNLPHELEFFKDFKVAEYVINLTFSKPIIVKPLTDFTYKSIIVEQTYAFAHQMRIANELVEQQKRKEAIMHNTFDKVDLKTTNVVIAINGYARSGKDTICGLFNDHLSDFNLDYNNVSSIDPIVKAMTLLGYDGIKTDKSRKMMSELKKLSVEYNDYPTTYLLDSIYRKSEKIKITFVHIREWNEIQKLKEIIEDEQKEQINKLITLFVERPNLDTVNNSSDNSVSDFKDFYNTHINNDGTLEELSEKVKQTITKLFI